MRSDLLFSEPLLWAAEEDDPYVDLIKSYIRYQLSAQLHYLAENYIRLNANARKRYMEFIEVAGSMLDVTEPVALSSECKAKFFDALDQLDAMSEAEKFKKERVEALPIFDFDNMHWRTKGTHAHQASCDNAPLTRYWRIDPSNESHQPKTKRTEYILVIEGALCDETGRYYETGSLYISPNGDTSQMPTCPDRGCIYLNVMDNDHRGVMALLSHLLKK